MANYIDRISRNYNFLEVQKQLWNKADEGCNFNHLWKKVITKRNILFAFKRLSSNTGRNTPGPDGLTYQDIKFEDEAVIVKECKKRLRGEIKPESRTVKIPKSSGNGFRRLGIGNIYDRLAQYAVLNILEPILEHDFYPLSFAYRRSRDALDCVQAIFYAIQSIKVGHLWDADLSSFFDLVNLDYVINYLKINHNIKDIFFLKRIKSLMSPTMDGHDYKLGLAQGSILGPVLANVLLHALEVEINNHNGYNRAVSLGHANPFEYIKKYSQHCINKNGLQYYENNYRKDRFAVKIIRYADDFVLVSNNSCDIYPAIDFVKDWIKRHDLKLNENKCQLIELKRDNDVNFTFLGYRLCRKKRNNGKWTFGPKNAAKVWNECRSKLREVIFAPKGDLKAMSIILGYYNYYSLTTNMEWFISRLDKMFYNWSRKTRKNEHKKHPNNFWKEKGHVIYHWNGTVFDLYDLRSRTRETWLERNFRRKKEMGWNPNKDSVGNYQQLIESYMDYGNIHEPINNISSFKVFIPGLVYKQKIDPISGESLNNIPYYDIVVHHKRPRSFGGLNDFNNLLLISVDTHNLLHYYSDEKLAKYVEKYPNFNKKAFMKYRKMATDPSYWDIKDKIG